MKNSMNRFIKLTDQTDMDSKNIEIEKSKRNCKQKRWEFLRVNKRVLFLLDLRSQCSLGTDSFIKRPEGKSPFEDRHSSPLKLIPSFCHSD